ncbi:TetR/AcrR family transcriptional regulator [Streptomyces sp. NPDC101227]|uniref:TetR/AcrR family transcriptional regulator n=1 Tax=Streptomyces sp. NPDC101227 TaxID=3366136 RepID=UPI003825738D
MPHGRTAAGRAPAAPSEGGQDEKPRRRQARGERRISQLLEAAAAVFCKSGYTAASTNAIAREAGVSPGTLYQFFPNKEAIAIELGGRLIHQMRDTYGEVLALGEADVPLRERLDGIVDRFVDFNCRHPVFFALMHGPDTPGRMVEEHDALHTALLARIQDLIAFYLPDAPKADIARTAEMSFGLFKAGVELILAHEDTERDAYVTELKNVLFRYLDPMIGEALAAPAQP